MMRNTWLVKPHAHPQIFKNDFIEKIVKSCNNDEKINSILNRCSDADYTLLTC
jgi:hypothetical protein